MNLEYNCCTLPSFALSDFHHRRGRRNSFGSWISISEDENRIEKKTAEAMELEKK
jgi:hypothetical protein